MPKQSRPTRTDAGLGSDASRERAAHAPIAVVTGASRGIGRSIARALAQTGHRVVANFLSDGARAESLVREIREDTPGEAIGVQADVSEPGDAEKLIRTTLDAYGTIDVLVNNAGVISDGLLLELEPDDWDAVWATNVLGAVHCTQAVLPEMWRRRAGTIVNLSSIAAIRPNAGQCNYAASKGALEAFTRAVARENGSRGIRCNAVRPGVIATDMSAELREAYGDLLVDRVALRRFGEPHEVAELVRFLSCDASSYVTGQVFTVDGGLSI